MATDPDLTVATKTRDPGDDRFSRGDEEADEASGVSAGEHRRATSPITQLVDKPNIGVHVKMPKSIFTSPNAGPARRAGDPRAGEALERIEGRAPTWARWRPLLADEWTVTHGDGTIDTKAQYLADLRSGDRKFFGDVKQDEFTVRVHGDTAIVAGISESKVEYKGRPGGGPLRFTRVYVKRDGRWQMVVSQATRRQP